MCTFVNLHCVPDRFFNYTSLKLLLVIFTKYAYCFSGSAAGNGTNSPFKFEKPIALKAGKNEIALLGMTVGIQVRFSLVIRKSHFYFLLALSDCDE